MCAACEKIGPHSNIVTESGKYGLIVTITKTYYF